MNGALARCQIALEDGRVERDQVRAVGVGGEQGADIARVAVLNATQAVDGAEMSLRRLLGRGTVEEVQAVLAVQPLAATAVPAPAPFQPWIRTVAAFDFATAIQLSQLTQAEAALAQARQNDQPQLDLTLAGSDYGNPALGFGGGGAARGRA